MNRPRLQVDIADPADVRAKLPEARQIADRLHAEQRRLAEQVDHWDRLVRVLEGIAGVRHGGNEAATSSAEPKQSRQSSVETVVAIVDQQGGPIKTAEVRRLAPDVKPDTVSWALWNASHSGRIQQLKRGLYAPLDWQGTLAAREEATT